MPFPANFSSCVLGAGFFCDPQLPEALRSVICYAQVYILHKCSLRKAVLPPRAYECEAQHHTDKRCTLCKEFQTWKQHSSCCQLPPCGNQHSSCNSSLQNKLRPAVKKTIQSQRWSDTVLSALVYWHRSSTSPGKEPVWQQQKGMAISWFSTSV